MLLDYEDNVAPTITSGFNAREVLNSVDGGVTVFIPSDDALKDVRINRIREDFSLLKQVRERFDKHFLCTHS